MGIVSPPQYIIEEETIMLDAGGSVALEVARLSRAQSLAAVVVNDLLDVIGRLFKVEFRSRWPQYSHSIANMIQSGVSRCRSRSRLLSEETVALKCSIVFISS